MTIKSITVYCSSSDKLSNKYYQDAEEISKLISSFKLTIVYGGAKVGIMGVCLLYTSPSPRDFG